jgi:N-methylhydantoinase B/oxoprolinase/acetone carboxylase alpha subunit
MLTPTTVTVLSERRTTQPYGAAGGAPGASGRNTVIRRDGRVEPIGGKARVELDAGDRLRIETPGGGGYGGGP